jgi:cGMP-dependent protein kinase 2
VQIVIEGEAGDKFYIIKEGEAVVFQTGPDGRQHKVNHLFRADFFGERALLAQEPRMATVSTPHTPANYLCFLWHCEQN